MSKEYFIGLMSGTSMDAIDAALVEFSDQHCLLRTTHQHTWPNALHKKLQEIQHSGQCSLKEIAQLDVACGQVFAEAVNNLLSKADMSAQQVSAIGSHGQTLVHGADEHPAFTVQIGDPNQIAEKTGITTVADFRRRDMAAGGQGAPLVPAFHEALFKTTGESHLLLNIGGIANITPTLPGK